MLFTLGLFLLLAPLPSFQITTNEKRDTRGSNVTKANTVLNLPKPKTTAAPSKQSEHPTLKPNTVNVTVLPMPASNQKPPTTNSTTSTKIRTGLAVNQTTPSAAGKATTTVMNKDRHKVNQTAPPKLPSLVDFKENKDKPAPTRAPNVQATSTKFPSTSKTTKRKPQHSTGHTSPKSPATSGEKTVKDKPAPNDQSPTGKTVSVSGSKTIKNKPTASVNQSAVAQHPPSSDEKSKDKPAATKVQTVQSTSTKGDKADGSPVKEEVSASANHTSSTSTTSEEKLGPSQPIRVVISDGCDSSQAKGQEVTLKPGAPLVMTHKISLLPGGCTGECGAEMASLKKRLAKLERDLSFIIEKCPCSANCPNDCSGNGKCEKGKCICLQGFVGPDCSKCAQGAGCSKETDEMNDKTVENEPKQVEKDKKNVTKVEKRHEAKDTTVTSNTKPSVTDRRQSEETHQGKTELPSSDKKGSGGKLDPNLDQLKDEPQSNITLGSEKKTNSTTKTGTPTARVNKKKIENESTEKSTPAEKNDTHSTGSGQTNTDKLETKKEQSTDRSKSQGGFGKKKENIANKTLSTTTEKTKAPNPKPDTDRTSRAGGLGSVKVENVSSHSFTITWLAPKGMFKNFTVIRKEPLTESDKDEHEGPGVEASKRDRASAAWSSAEVQSESTNSTLSSAKTAAFKRKSDTKRISMVIPGNVRSVEFSNLKANTHYALQIYGTTADRRSKIHRVTAITGPEPPTDLVFSNVTEHSLAISWTKPKSASTGFRVTYINLTTGKSRFVAVGAQQSRVVLSELSAGSSYVVSITASKGRAQSDELTSVITTVPAPPTHLQVNNVTDTRAVLHWTPSLGKVDRFIVSYESSKTANVTVTVMLSGNSVQYELKGLQRGTLYKVKVLSQKDSLKSVAATTTFTTANVIKASEVGARSAVISWRAPVLYHSYRVIYQVAGEKAKEVSLEPPVTEYKLTGLLPVSRYTVLVQGEKNGDYTTIVTSQFVTGKLRFPFPTECSQELLNGALESGEVDVYPQGKEGRAVRVYCDMETDGGGWTVFQRRVNGKTDFYRNWSDYRAGFGNLSEEFWLGNELLHDLTSMGPVGLRVDMRFGNDTAYAHYANFSIASEERNYTLTVSGFTGTAGDSMRYHNGRPFSTRDREPRCTRDYMGGWWYKNCYKANLNGLYGVNSNNKGVIWIDWKGKDSSIPFTEMKFRPSRFSPVTHG